MATSDNSPHYEEVNESTEAGDDKAPLQGSKMTTKSLPAKCAGGDPHRVLLVVSCVALCTSLCSFIMLGVMIHRLGEIAEQNEVMMKPLGEMAKRTTAFLDSLDKAHGFLEDAIASTLDEGHIKQTCDGGRDFFDKLASINWELTADRNPELCWDIGPDDCMGVTHRTASGMSESFEKASDFLEQLANTMSSAPVQGDYSTDVYAPIAAIWSLDWHNIAGRCKSIASKIAEANWDDFVTADEFAEFKATVSYIEHICGKVEAGFA